MNPDLSNLLPGGIAPLARELLIPTSFYFSTIDRVVGLGLRTGRVESQRRFAVGPEVRPYPGAGGQSPNAMGPWYKTQRGDLLSSLRRRHPADSVPAALLRARARACGRPQPPRRNTI